MKLDTQNVVLNTLTAAMISGLMMFAAPLSAAEKPQDATDEECSEPVAIESVQSTSKS